MKDALRDGSHFDTCLKPGIDRGCEIGLYGNRGMIQLEVRNVNLSLPRTVVPGLGAVLKYPDWLFDIANWYRLDGCSPLIVRAWVKSVSFDSQ